MGRVFRSMKLQLHRMQLLFGQIVHVSLQCLLFKVADMLGTVAWIMHKMDQFDLSDFGI
jgi:hypothetical protein